MEENAEQQPEQMQQQQRPEQQQNKATSRTFRRVLLITRPRRFYPGLQRHAHAGNAGVHHATGGGLRYEKDARQLYGQRQPEATDRVAVKSALGPV